MPDHEMKYWEYKQQLQGNEFMHGPNISAVLEIVLMKMEKAYPGIAESVEEKVTDWEVYRIKQTIMYRSWVRENA